MGWCENLRSEVCTSIEKESHLCWCLRSSSLEALGLELSIEDGVLKMNRGSMVVLKGVRCNNIYYLKGSTVTG